jgi:hypothetical protein
MGVFVKIQGSGDFLEMMDCFSKEKHVEYVHGAVDRVHDVSRRVHESFIKPQSSNRRWMGRI